MLIFVPRHLVTKWMMFKYLRSQCYVKTVFYHLWLVNKELISLQLTGEGSRGRTSDPSEWIPVRGFTGREIGVQREGVERPNM